MVILGMRVLYEINRKLILVDVLNVLNVSNLSLIKKKKTLLEINTARWSQTVRQYPDSFCPAARSGANFKVSIAINDSLFTLPHLDGILV